MVRGDPLIQIIAVRRDILALVGEIQVCVTSDRSSGRTDRPSSLIWQKLTIFGIIASEPGDMGPLGG